jgi:hypothetical protein
MSGCEQVTAVCSAAVHWQGHKMQPAVQTGHLTAQQQCVSCFSAKLYIAGAALELLLPEEYSLLFNASRGKAAGA